MKKSKKIFILVIIIITIFINKVYANSSNIITSDIDKQIEEYIIANMNEGKIPGVSVVIVKDENTVYQKGFGFSDVSEMKTVDTNTLFEIGSMSKAFTALAILKLENEGSINLEDSVKSYLPWFHVNFEDKNVNLKLKHLLYHTSGIPFNTIGDIPIDDSKSALDKTVRKIIGKTLEFMPGEKFLYATINYDILGLIIEKVSKQSFEDYINDNIINTMALENTYLNRQDVLSKNMSKGYKLSFTKAIEYEAPIYRGNTPAGYFISNSQDMSKWLKIQLGTYEDITFDKQIIEKSHQPDRTVSPHSDGSSYAAGWNTYQRGGGEISHYGNNPNYSSFIAFRPEEKIGVVVLANLNSSYTSIIGQGIINILMDKNLPDIRSDMYMSLDNISSTVVIVTIPIILTVLVFFFLYCKEAFKRKLLIENNVAKIIYSIISLILFLAIFTYCLYRIPNVIFYELNWEFVKVWAPQTLIYSVILFFTMTVLFLIYYLITVLLPQKNSNSYFILIILSIASGFGNAFIIFTVNETFNRKKEFQGGLLLYFLLGIIIYVLGQKIIRTRLIKITNSIVYKKRMELIDKILGTSYQEIEQIEYENIQAALNNDTETISNFTNIVIAGITSMVTLVFCFIYMGIISFYGLLLAFAIILIAAGLHFFIGKRAHILWEQTRDIQNIFFKFINDLIGGFKELRLNKGKCNDFREDMEDSCETYKSKRIEGDTKLANVNVIGELLFTFVIGTVAFVFPIIFNKFESNLLRSYVFILLYMTGPVNVILNAIPNVFKVKVSWERINQILNQLDNIKTDFKEDYKEDHNSKSLNVELKGVEYHYKNKEGEGFCVGPIDFQFKSGEITFITGGNGSGKSTLAKLITGLYTPDSGEVYVNGLRISPFELSQKYSAIFSDFYLFDKLYGIDFSYKKEAINKYLKLLCIDDKVNINNGVFSSVKLSTGQRKRLALMISYAEDRPVYMFDEWAADQDPEFRHFFYNSLLPELRSKGKCIIAITHDDRYFNMADKIIKMEMGKLVMTEHKKRYKKSASPAV